MGLRFPKGLVHGYELLIPDLQLPDPNDRHVLAAAIHAEAKCIVTKNLKHFPKTVMESHKIKALSPDDFVLRFIKIDKNPVLRAAKKHRSNLINPPKTADEYIAALELRGLTETAECLWEHKDSI
jgi:hypothetical protein